MEIIQVDTREKRNDHIVDVLDAANGITVLRSKLPFGDYCNISRNVFRVVERKNSINELCSCLGKQHERFKNELANGHKLGYHFIILIEAEGFTTIEDLKNWENPFRKKCKRALTGEQLYKILDTFQRCYNIEVVFTTKEKAGADIIRLLNTKKCG